MEDHMEMVRLYFFALNLRRLTLSPPGVYLAKDGSISMGCYAVAGRSTWRKSKICPTNCVALAEIVNLPSQFVSDNPYFVIKDTDWIVWYSVFFPLLALLTNRVFRQSILACERCC